MPIAVSFTIWLQVLGIHVQYTCTLPVFAINAVVSTTALSTHTIAMSCAWDVGPVITAKATEMHI